MRLWVRLPLRTQLTTVFIVLLVLGLVTTGALAQGLLQRSLVAQVDAELASAMPRLVDQARRGTLATGPGDASPPSPYHVWLHSVDGDVVGEWQASTGAASEPDLPPQTVDQVIAMDGGAFTVQGSEAVRWRALSGALALAADGSVVGSITVALPLTSADATLRQMRTALLAIGVLVVGLGALAGWLGVRRALRPLREIETTAATIAAGDLSKRVPDEPTSTEVGRLGAALNGMLSQIEHAFDERTASEQRMRRFVADASHELRTPLATIRGYGELYRMGALTSPEEVDGTIGRIEDAARRMGVLVEDLLQLARLDENRPLLREEVDLAVLAADAAADLRALDPGRSIRLIPLVPEATLGGVIALGDEARLRQVVANLVGNVAQHTPAGSPVELAVGRSGHVPDRVVLEVRDHGQGIDAEHARRVFERFYRVDDGRSRDSGGSGLGMAIVAAIVAAHDGEVSIEPTPGGGATVRVTLPTAP